MRWFSVWLALVSSMGCAPTEEMTADGGIVYSCPLLEESEVACDLTYRAFDEGPGNPWALEVDRALVRGCAGAAVVRECDRVCDEGAGPASYYQGCNERVINDQATEVHCAERHFEYNHDLEVEEYSDCYWTTVTIRPL